MFAVVYNGKTKTPCIFEIALPPPHIDGTMFNNWIWSFGRRAPIGWDGPEPKPLGPIKGNGIEKNVLLFSKVTENSLK